MGKMKKITAIAFNLEDIAQLTIGSFALAVPIAFTEEAWRISESLPTLNLVVVFGLSLGFLALFAYQSVFQGHVAHRLLAFVFRVIIAYIITAFVVSLVLFSLDKLPWISHPEVALMRTIVVTMPASVGAIIVDSFDKE